MMTLIEISVDILLVWIGYFRLFRITKFPFDVSFNLLFWKKNKKKTREAFAFSSGIFSLNLAEVKTKMGVWVLRRISLADSRKYCGWLLEGFPLV
jgi:hypothetical protein